MRFRGTLSNSGWSRAIEVLNDYIHSQGASKTGDIVTAIHVLHLDTKTFEAELFVPIDRIIPSTKDFIYMPVLKLANCISTKHMGNSHLIPKIYTELYHKAKSMGLEVKQPFYNVFRDEIDGIWGSEEVDIYVATKRIE